MKQNHCKRCLLKDLSDDDYFKNVYEYIQSLPPEVKTAADLYEQRLAICKKCTHLVNGMCALCGCFVEVRAAVHRNRCSKDQSVW